MPSPEQNPHWVSPEIWPTRPGHHSPVPQTFNQQRQNPAPGLRPGSRTSSTNRAPSADTGFTQATPGPPAKSSRSRWRIPRPFRRPPRTKPSLPDLLDSPAPLASPLPIWELEAHFLRSFDAYENAMIHALCIRLGPVAEHLSLHDRIQFLADLGIRSEADRAVWADCLKVRFRVLLCRDQHHPGRDEITRAWEAMNALETSLTAWIGQQTCP